MTLATERGASTAWITLLTVASTLATLALACATPLAALAAIAATRMRLRDGIALIVLTWAASQAVGFCVLDYPTDLTTIAWGGAIGSAAVAALFGARWAAGAVAGGPVLRLATAFGAGFIAYKAALLGWSFVLGGVHTALSPWWTAQQFVREAAFVVALVLAYETLVAIGVPPAQGRRASA